jgi:hypothetical protein
MSVNLTGISRVYINSDTDRQAGQTSGNFTALLPKPLQYPKKVRVIGASIPYFFPSFKTTNNTFNFRVGVTNYSFSFNTNQNYDGVSLASYIALNMTAQAGITFTTSFNSASGYLTITTTSALAPTGWQLLATSTCLDKIGFSTSNLVAPLIGLNYSLVGDLPVNLLRTQNIYILSSLTSAQGSNADANNIKFNILYKIPVNTGYFGIIANQAQFIEASYNLYQNSLDSIDLQLVDDEYLQLDLPANLYWTLELNFDY